MAHASRDHVARALIGLCLAAPGVSLLAAAPATADPSVDKAEHKVDTIGHDRKIVAKKAQQTRETLVDAKRDLALTHAEQRLYRTALVKVQQRLADLASQEGAGIGRALTAASDGHDRSRPRPGVRRRPGPAGRGPHRSRHRGLAPGEPRPAREQGAATVGAGARAQHALPADRSPPAATSRRPWTRRTPR